MHTSNQNVNQGGGNGYRGLGHRAIKEQYDTEEDAVKPVKDVDGAISVVLIVGKRTT